MAAAAGLRRAGGRFLLAREIRTSGGNGHFLGRGGVTMPRALLEDSAPAMDAPATTTTGRGPPPSAASAAASRITPAVLFVTVVLAVVLLVSGLLQVLRRLFLKSHHASASAGDRHQLQHLFFPAHDDGAGSGSGGGLGQVAIDALPEFAYGELSGSAAATAASRKGKEKAARPFDCAVCLCEFADHDQLRLLPLCGHAFHVACIDVWLRSSATCPLCRTKLSERHLAVEAQPSSVGPDVEEQKPQQDQAPPEAAEAASSSVVLPVRLGRFKNADDDAESSSSTGATSRIDRRGATPWAPTSTCSPTSTCWSPCTCGTAMRAPRAAPAPTSSTRARRCSRAATASPCPRSGSGAAASGCPAASVPTTACRGRRRPRTIMPAQTRGNTATLDHTVVDRQPTHTHTHMFCLASPC